MANISIDIINKLNEKIVKPKGNLVEALDTNSDDIQVYMNTWKNYNEYGADLSAYGINSLADGWMTPEEGLEFCKKYANDEPFINDVDNCPFEVSEYGNAVEDLESMIKYNEFQDKTLLKNAIETDYFGNNDIESYIDKLESGDYVWFPDVSNDKELGEAYVDMVGFEGISDKSNYFDSDAWKDEVRADEESYYREEYGLEDEEEWEEKAGDFEDYLDAMADEMSENYDGSDESLFNYEKLGDELEMNGYTFTSDGCICLF